MYSHYGFIIKTKYSQCFQKRTTTTIRTCGEHKAVLTAQACGVEKHVPVRNGHWAVEQPPTPSDLPPAPACFSCRKYLRVGCLTAASDWWHTHDELPSIISLYTASPTVHWHHRLHEEVRAENLCSKTMRTGHAFRRGLCSRSWSPLGRLSTGMRNGCRPTR